jgi:predicted nucleic acid-binding Zn ribbon protein
MCADRLTGEHPENSADFVTPLSTGIGGQGPESVDDRPSYGNKTDMTTHSLGTTPVENSEPADLARAALANAQTSARSRPDRRFQRGDRAGRQARTDNSGRRGGYSAAGPDPARDPLPVGQVLAGYVQDRGWDRPLAEGRVFTDWSQLVGPDVAAHCEPQSLVDGELRIAAQSTAWATQLRLLAGTLLARLVAELGPQVVTKLHITGPVAPSWKHGGRSVRGHRGPRDTYG